MKRLEISIKIESNNIADAILKIEAILSSLLDLLQDTY